MSSCSSLGNCLSREQATDQLLPLVSQELRELASAKFSKGQRGQSLQPIMLVHEAYLRLVDVAKPQKWQGRGHFFAATGARAPSPQKTPTRKGRPYSRGWLQPADAPIESKTAGPKFNPSKKLIQF